MTPATIPNMAQQAQALAAAAAERFREECIRVGRDTSANNPAVKRAALHRRVILGLLSRGAYLTVRELREGIAASPFEGIDRHISRNAVYHLADDIRQRGWAAYEVPGRAGLPVGTGRTGAYRITDLGMAALAAMRENEPTPATTGDH